MYVVPFRALATEVKAGLGQTLGDLGVRVSSPFGGYESSELEDYLLSSSSLGTVEAAEISGSRSVAGPIQYLLKAPAVSGSKSSVGQVVSKL